MKIGILYICVGKYDIFFEDFYKSCEDNFFSDVEKTYYVWTDSEKEVFNKSNIHKFYLQKLGWPYDTMMRFHRFNAKAKSILEHGNTHIYFFNANMIVNSIIDDRDLDLEADLVGVLHPHFWSSPVDNLPYERFSESNVSIPMDEGRYYYQGCFNGGKASKFLDMSKTLMGRIDKDLDKNHIPIWHDESALNWYYNSAQLKIQTLNPGFAYPESLYLPFTKRIIQLDKSKRGGHEYLRS